MAVVSITNVTPPARYDDLPWTTARVEQSATETGSYTLLEEFDLDPVDADPTDPLPRSFTTELATAGYWHRVVFVDEDGDLSDPSAPVQDQASPSTVVYATRAELAAILKVNATANDDALDRVLLAAAGEIRDEIERDDDLAGWELALAAEVNLERAVEHWQQSKSPFGVIGLGADLAAVRTPTDSWARHANKLRPLKDKWGIA